jgi:hypothetical protein
MPKPKPEVSQVLKLYKNTVTVEVFDLTDKAGNKRHPKILVNDETKLSVTKITDVSNMDGKMEKMKFWVARTNAAFLETKKPELIAAKDPETIQALIDESKGEYRKKSSEAATLGTQVHEWVNKFLTDKKQPPLPKDERVLFGVMAFLKWIGEHKVKFLASEEVVYSKKYDYTGIMDARAIIEKQHCIVDFKTSSGIYPEMYLQVAGYQLAWEEMQEKKYQPLGNRWIIRFDKETGEFDAHEIAEYKQDRDAFLAALTLRRREAALKK